MKRIALIDDDRELRELVGAGLAQHGFEVDPFADADAFWSGWSLGRWDLVVLDVMLPGQDGFTIARLLRERGEQAPILMLTARTDETDRVVGLEVGADDYLTKPFGPRELVARVRALIRRSQMSERRGPLSRIDFGRWTLDTVTRQLEDSDGTVVSLSGIEFKLLALLLEQPGHVRSRDEISLRLYCRDAAPLDRSVDLLMSKLRAKLSDDAREPRLIKTVRGEGYVLATRAATR
ncbi:MAG: response regulator transcription factor [Burkholderiaceae bacterium]|nr:response regulator transcription factor [Burkholderiaceae bacterium]